MRIDSHQHYWLYEPVDYSWISDEMPSLKRNILPVDIKATLDEYHFDGVIAVQARQTLTENAFLLGLANDYQWIKGVIGWVDIAGADLAVQLEEYQNSKMKGFRHLIQDEANPSEFFVNPTFNQGIKKLLQAGYLYEVLFHEKDLKAATEFCLRHNNHPLIIDHLGKPNIAEKSPSEWRKNIQELAKLPHVYCKLFGLITEAGPNWQVTDVMPFIEIAIECFTPERLMFGSDWPVCQLAGSYENVYELIEEYLQRLSDDEQAAIMGDVACQIYRI